jgi:hypothetical protein
MVPSPYIKLRVAARTDVEDGIIEKYISDNGGIVILDVICS